MAAGRAPAGLVAADEHLEDEDLLDMLNVGYHYLDIVPKGRDEEGVGAGWIHRRDEYPD